MRAVSTRERGLCGSEGFSLRSLATLSLPTAPNSPSQKAPGNGNVCPFFQTMSMPTGCQALCQAPGHPGHFVLHGGGPAPCDVRQAEVQGQRRAFPPVSRPRWGSGPRPRTAGHDVSQPLCGLSEKSRVADEPSTQQLRQRQVLILSASASSHFVMIIKQNSSAFKPEK